MVGEMRGGFHDLCLHLASAVDKGVIQQAGPGADVEGVGGEPMLRGGALGLGGKAPGHVVVAQWAGAQRRGAAAQGAAQPAEEGAEVQAVEARDVEVAAQDQRAGVLAAVGAAEAAQVALQVAQLAQPGAGRAGRTTGGARRSRLPCAGAARGRRCSAGCPCAPGSRTGSSRLARAGPAAWPGGCDPALDQDAGGVPAASDPVPAGVCRTT